LFSSIKEEQLLYLEHSAISPKATHFIINVNRDEANNFLHNCTAITPVMIKSNNKTERGEIIVSTYLIRCYNKEYILNAMPLCHLDVTTNRTNGM
jgi:hypothetical protein